MRAKSSDGQWELETVTVTLPALSMAGYPDAKSERIVVRRYGFYEGEVRTVDELRSVFGLDLSDFHEVD